MFRRYAPVCLLIMAVSGGTAALAYKGSAAPQFAASCHFEVFVRGAELAQGQPTPDFLKFTAALAAAEVQSATPPVYQQVAKSNGTTENSLTAKLFTTAAPGVGAFRVTIIDSEPQRSIKIANAVCEQFVTVIKKQRVEEIDSDVKVVEGRITTIQAEIKRLQRIPVKRRTPADTATLATQRVALTRNAGLIATMVSLPPDHISVLKRATGVLRSQTVKLSKYLLIAVVAGLLTCFLLILIGEFISESRKSSGESARSAQ